MKKTLIAMAVLAASSAAMAQSSVQVYGLVDLVLHKDKNAATALTTGGVATSRWGLKGTEDLGGGLKAIFKLEQAFNADNGTVRGGTGFTRESYVGLGGGFGEVKLGKVWSAYDDVAGAGDSVFGANVLSPLNLVFASWAGYTGNPNNTIYYSTPDFGGISGAISYSLDESNGVSNDIVSLHVKYANGPFAVALAHQDEGDTAAVKYTTLNGSYDLGMATVKATYANVNNAGAVADVNEYALGVDVPLGGAMTASLGYGNSKTKGVNKAKVSISGAVAYSLSKRTLAYVGVASTSKNAGLESRYGVGIQHSF
jgi:predicted porin